LNFDYFENVADLGTFEGSYNISRDDEIIRGRMDIANFIPRSGMIRNTKNVLGLVVYVGSKTKIMKNTQQRIFKKSTLEKKMNKYIIIIICILVVLLLILVFIAAVTKGNHDFAYKAFGYD